MLVISAVFGSLLPKQEHFGQDEKGQVIWSTGNQLLLTVVASKLRSVCELF
jgi:hypothetical protein